MFRVINYFQLMYWRTFEKCVLNIRTRACTFSYCARISMAGTLKNTKVKFDLLTDIDMLLMVTKCIRGGTYYAIY